MARVHARRRRTLALCCFAALLALIVLSARPQPAGAEGGGALVAEPVLSATAAGVRVLFGASPLESPGEVWGAGAKSGEGGDIIHYTEAGGWEALPPPTDEEGQPVALNETAIPTIASAGRTTPAGGLVAIATLGPRNSTEPQVLLVRDPGGLVRAIHPPEEFFETNEKLFTTFPLQAKVTAVEEENGKTGVFLIAGGGAATTEVVHYDGSEWSRDPICFNPPGEPCTERPGTSSGTFTPIAIEGTSPQNAWILARRTKRVGTKSKGEGVLLLKRTAGGEWRRQPLGGVLGAVYSEEEREFSGTKVFFGARTIGQPLTVSPAGVWVDVSLQIGSREAPQEGATIYYDFASGEVTGSWCNLAETSPEMAEAFCATPLGIELPVGESRSFAWAGNGAPGEEFGTRTITGVGHGAIAIFEHGAFTKVPLDGNGGTSAGAALSAPDQGWLGPSYRLTRSSVPSGLQPWPVPFRRPLRAIVGQPGKPAGDLNSEAMAVGNDGQVAHYLPGVGWQPEALLTGSGARATPNLTGVAWPEPGIAYAVGTEGAMWLWRGSTGFWEPDPGAPPNLIRGNFTGIAFDPNEPARGYAVGQQGLLLAYGKRWTQEALPAGLNPEVNITSIAFAGEEAIATYSIPVLHEGSPFPVYEGGLIVNKGDGTGWHIEEGASKALAPAEARLGEVGPRLVAGLPDGGAVVVGVSGGVIERDVPGAPWHVAPGAPLGHPVAVAATREGGQLRAIVSISANTLGGAESELGVDEPQATGQPQPGQPPLLTKPYPLPPNAFLVRQTATGWQDEERRSFPAPESVEGQGAYDMPRTPDAILAMLVSPEGGGGWTVGGVTGENGATYTYERDAMQTAGVMRYGGGAAPPSNAATQPIVIPSETEGATFAVGGGAACAGQCADLAGTGIGPQVWLRSAVEKAAGIAGLRAFLYTGGGVSPGASGLARRQFAEEEAAYASRLGSVGGSLPVYAAPTATDLFSGSLSVFDEKFVGFQQPLGATVPREGTYPLSISGEAGAQGSYEFESRNSTSGMPVRVVVLNESVMPLSTETRCWLATRLAEAKAVQTPVIVLGNREVGGETELLQLLVTGEAPGCTVSGPGGASVYLFESHANREQTLTWGTTSIPAFGTGTLGYTPISEPGSNQYSPASGFLLVSVGVSNPANNIAPVTRAMVPNIGSLAIDATDGTLLRRSQTALFEALARRPEAGFRCAGNTAPGGCQGVSPDPYAEIPARCIRGFQGGSCSSEILPEYTFTSSRPDIANFVKVDPASTNPRAVYLLNGKPEPDPKSGLLCAFNAGTTTVTVSTGGLSYSVPITVQAGSVAQPCGTVPLSEQPVPPPKPTAPPPPPIEQAPTHFHKPQSIPTTPPPPNISHAVPVQPVINPAPNPPAVHHPIKPPVTQPLPFFPVQNPGIIPIVPFIPPPPAPALEPTPPSGTSPVTQPAVSPEPEEEEEAAFDLVHHMAAYRHARARNAAAIVSSSRDGSPSFRYFVPALVLLIALAGAGIATPRRRTQRLAYETRATPRRPLR
jgi:hypothetical protein